MSAAPHTHSSSHHPAEHDNLMFVTMRVDRQLFGVPVKYVRDVLREQHVTKIPLSPPEISGSLNLRGRIVTVVNLRTRLHLSARKESSSGMFVVVEHKNELFSLMVDTVGDVLTVSAGSIEKTPANLGAQWKDVASGIYKLDNELLVIMDIESLLTIIK